MATIYIIRSGDGWLGIDGASIPPDQADQMNEWLEARDLTLRRLDGASLAQTIERLYPRGLDGWASAHNCTIKTES